MAFFVGRKRTWVNLPPKAWIGHDKRHKTDINRKPACLPVLEWGDRALVDRFSERAIALIRRNTQSRLAVGIDTRGEGGFVIWWPAAGYSVISNAAPAPWPLWLLETLLQPAASPRPLNHDGKGLLPPAVPASILKPLERAIARAPEEPRNSILFWAACRVGEVIAVGQINTELATELLARAAAIAGLPEAVARRTIASGFARSR